MIPEKLKSRVSRWLGLAVAVLCSSACSSPPPSPRVPVPIAAARPVSTEARTPAPLVQDPWAVAPTEPPPKRSFADTLRNLDPGFRYEMAEAIAAYGETSVEAREAYAVALTLLDSFPT